VAVVAGRSTGYYYAPDYSRLLVFKLGANLQLPPALEFTMPQLNPPPSIASVQQIALGEKSYQDNCIICHGDVGNAGGIFRRGLFPELALSSALASPELFSAIVLDGVRSANGMVSFADIITVEQSEAIRGYLIEQANRTLQARQAP